MVDRREIRDQEERSDDDREDRHAERDPEVAHDHADDRSGERDQVAYEGQDRNTDHRGEEGSDDEAELLGDLDNAGGIEDRHAEHDDDGDTQREHTEVLIALDERKDREGDQKPLGNAVDGAGHRNGAACEGGDQLSDDRDDTDACRNEDRHHRGRDLKASVGELQRLRLRGEKGIVEHQIQHDADDRGEQEIGGFGGDPSVGCRLAVRCDIVLQLVEPVHDRIRAEKALLRLFLCLCTV